jgi:DNA-binding SARP family transcriptional activator/tetratricopeptide (TPR) repeat protein
MGTRSRSGPGPAAERSVRLLVAGPFTVEVGKEAAVAPREVSRKARTLLKLLALERGHLVSTDRIVEVLWPDGPPAQPVENVATLVSRLRSWLGPAVVEGSREGYRLGPDADVDLARAERLTERAEQALTDGHSGVALVPAEQAGRLLTRGAVLEDEPYAAWAEPARREQAALLRRARLAHIQAALTSGEPHQAVVTAMAGVQDDPMDEEMTRRLMAAYRDAAQPARALAAYAALREVLADDFGTDPAPETEALHVALLRDEPLPQPVTRAGAGTGHGSGLVERERQLAQLRDAWGAAAAGRSSVVLVVGEAGIGKTSLAEALARDVEASGGRVLRARCYEAERSLLLQPIVDALTPVVGALPPHRLRDFAGNHVQALAGLVPAAALALGPAGDTAAPAEATQRRAFEAVLHLLRRLGDEAPVLLLLDDLHNAGSTTAEAVRYLARRGESARLLVVGTVRREEGASALATLADVSAEVEPQALSAAAVERLAVSAGLADQAAAIARSTRGHPFFVVEVLRGLAAGQESLPGSLQSAVLDRVARAGEPVERLLRAASVLSAEVDPGTVAALLGITDEDASERCEHALVARLLTVSDRAYEFANDLVREVLYESTPAPTRLAWHRRAADLAGDNHEAMAGHAMAAGEESRAAQAWLLAAEEALAQGAISDAEALATRAADAAEATRSMHVLGRSLLIRGRAREAREAYADALADLLATAEVAHESGDQRLEMTAQRALAGDVPIALGLGVRYLDPYIDRGLLLARSLGDRSMEADLLSRRAVIMSNRLQLSDALDAANAAVAAARSSGDPGAVVAALDGLKTAYSFIGDVRSMRIVLDELEPQLRSTGDLWRLQWSVFESAYPAMAEADWGLAENRMRAALEINRRSGFLAYGNWFEAHLGWLLRLAGRHDEAVEVGRRAVATRIGGQHPWWRSTACLLLAGTLLEVGERAEAADLLAEGLAAAEQDGSDAYVLGCLALLADVSGDPGTLAAADAKLHGVQVPDGQVWMLGAESYLAVARAWLAAGNSDRADEVLAPLVAAARAQGWGHVIAQATELTPG